VSITKPAVVFDRNGLSLSPGQVYLEPVLVVGLLASTDYPELVNTGILDGNNVPVPIQVYAVYNRAEAAYSTLDPTSADLQCTSSPDILISSADCSTIMLAMAYSGEIATNLTITHVPSSQSFLLPLKIWQVYDLAASCNTRPGIESGFQVVRSSWMFQLFLPADKSKTT